VRTTLDIDEDVLRAAKELARRDKTTAGAVISQLARRALTAPSAARPRQPKPLHGFRPFRARGAVVTNERIDELRDEDAY
jgi:hypothetical protein